MTKGGRLTGVWSGAVFEPHNGRITQSGNVSLTKGESQKGDCMQIVKATEKVKSADERQEGQLSNENMESSDIDPEGDKEVVRPLEEDQVIKCDRSATNKCLVNEYSGQNVSKEDTRDLGQKQIGPSMSATKVYVRRKEVLPSKRKDHYLQGTEVEIGPVTKIDSMLTTQGDLLEKQCALVKE